MIGDGHLEGEVQFNAYFTAPVSSSIVATAEIRRIRKGRYGMEATAA